MKRKILDKLKEWKRTSAGKTAVLLEGARRVGKSYIAEQFAREEYKSYILVDFNRAGKQIASLFDDGLDDLDTLFLKLSNYYGVKLYERESVIVFDEVQLCPRARAAVKYLVADGRYDYIETGSLMSIKKNVKDIVIPSEERRIKMCPMDFEEFLWAVGNDVMIDYLRSCFVRKKPVGQMLHRKASCTVPTLSSTRKAASSKRRAFSTTYRRNCNGTTASLSYKKKKKVRGCETMKTRCFG